MPMVSSSARWLFRVLACSVTALSALSQPRNLVFERISLAQGLSQDIVKTILQDHQGFLWFGTEDGLNRYDGYSVRVYKHDPRDSTTLAFNTINDLYEDSRDRLWIGTDNGLDLYDPTSDRFIRFGNMPADSGSLSDNVVLKIREDRHGTLWVATFHGLNRYDEVRHCFIRYRYDPHDASSINDDLVMSILPARDGSLWVATANGICRYEESSNRFTRYLFEARGGHRRSILRLIEAQPGALWLVQADRGVWNFNIAEGSLQPLPLPTGRPANDRQLADGVVSAIAVDNAGYLWIGHFHGLDVYDPRTGSFAHYEHNPDDPDGLSGRVNCIYRDRIGVMWLGTFQGGVDRCDPYRQKFLLYRHVPGSDRSLSGNQVSAILEDRRGDVWIGTDHGLDRLDPRSGRFTHFRHMPGIVQSIGADQVNALGEDSRGNLWIGVGDGSTSVLDRLDETRRGFIHYPIRRVKSIHEDSRGVLWIGKINETDTGEDLVRIDHSGHILSRDTIAGTGVWCIYEDRQGFLWFGGQYCCLNRYDPRTGRFTAFEAHYTSTGQLNSGAVRSMYEDEDGILWMGTWGGGLNAYDRRTNTFRTILEQDGLPTNYVKGILPDSHGNLWISTERGLSQFDRKAGRFKNYLTEDGLQGDRFLSGSCFEGRNGWMYFGGMQGLNMFHPDSVRDNPNVPPVLITGFKVFDRPYFASYSVSGDQPVRLAYDQDFLSFEFVALDYTSPHRNRYAYRMEGFDRDWVAAETRRYASYTRLAPGEYVFRVRASNNDGVWNMEGASVKIVVAPPFWMTPWFIGLAILGVSSVLYLFYRNRINQLVAMEQLRTRIASDLHDDVGTDLSSIVVATEALGHRVDLPPRERGELKRIGAIALNTQEMMRDIVWVLRSQNDSLNDMVLKMRDVAARMLRGVSYSFRGPDAPPAEKVSLEAKRTIFLFYKECLNNIVRHAAATKVDIEVSAREGAFRLTVGDNGRGFDPNVAAAGVGLKSLRSRADLLGGALDISSNQGEGTTITLTVKTPQMRHGN